MSPKGQNTGNELNQKWRVGAQQARYHRDGYFFMPLDKFPAALFDPDGYILFRTKSDYWNCEGIRITDRIYVPGGISKLHGYKKVRQWIAQHDKPESAATLADLIRQCRRAGLYEIGRALYEKSGMRFDGLDEVELIELEEDYQVCVRRSEVKPVPRRKNQPLLFDESDV